MRNIIILLILVSVIGLGLGNRQRYVLRQTCTDNTTGNVVQNKKCNGNNARYTLLSTCYDNVEKQEVDLSFCR